MRNQSLFTWLFAIVASVMALVNHAGAQTIWAVGNTEKITPKAPVQDSNYVWSSTGKQVSIKAARNEHEPFHLVITADSGPLYGVRISVSDLTGGSNTIASDNITLYREVFLNVTRKSQYPGHPILGITGFTPDALVPFKDPYGSTATPGVPFDVPSGENQPIWVDIYVPSDTPAGNYIGTITVKEGTAIVDTIALALDVWDFEIPVEQHLKGIIYDFVSDMEWLYSTAYGVKDIPDALMENHYQALGDRRFGTAQIHKRPTYDDQTGFDWTDADPLYIRLINAYHFPVLNMPSIYYEILGEEQYAIRDPNGLPYTVADFTQGSDFMTKAINYYQRLYDDLSIRGWTDIHLAMLDDESGHVSDEPYNIGQEGYKRVKLWSGILHSANPNIRFLVAGDSIIPSASYDDIRGYVDIWDMYMDEIQFNALAYKQHLAANPDEELWMVPNAYADFIDYPSIYRRTLGWFAYKYGVSGIELWSAYAWLDANEEYYDPWKVTSLADAPFGLGAGALFYPGYNIENRGINIQGPVTSIRMELNREAMEDYEYLFLLEQLMGSSYGKSLADKIIPSHLYYGIPTKPEDFYATRDAIGDILSKGITVPTATITGLVKDSQSVPIAGALVSTDGAAAITDANGAYSITVMPGTYTVKASAYKYLSSTRSITVEPNELRTEIDFTLTPVSQESVLLFNSFENLADIWKDVQGAVAERSSAYATDGSYSMKVTFDETVKDANVGVEYESSQDWTNYTSLELDIYNDSPYRSPLDISIYNSKWESVYELQEMYLAPEAWRHIKIPIDTSFNDVLAIELYIDNYGRGNRAVYIDNIRLTIIISAQYTLTITSGTGGTTSPEPGTHTYESGTEVTITAIPDSGYRFSEWSGDASGTDTPITITMDSNKSVMANFIRQYKLTTASGTGGTTDPSPGTHTYDSGTKVAIKATPNTGYTFSGWTGDVPSGHQNDNPLDITMDSDKSITANFTKASSDSEEEGGGGGCFIATACYGTPMAEEVKTLRAFRDQYLVTSPTGRAFINFYYSYGPKAGDFIREREYLRTIVREFLKPVVWIITSLVRDS